MVASKSRYRKSDRGMRTHAEPFRCDAGFLNGFYAPVTTPLDAVRHESMGRTRSRTDSCLCACGKPALRTWKNVGYCKAHAPKKVG